MGCGNVVVVSGSDHDPDHRLERRVPLGHIAALLWRRWPLPSGQPGRVDVGMGGAPFREAHCLQYLPLRPVAVPDRT